MALGEEELMVPTVAGGVVAKETESWGEPGSSSSLGGDGDCSVSDEDFGAKPSRPAEEAVEDDDDDNDSNEGKEEPEDFEELDD